VTIQFLNRMISAHCLDLRFADDREPVTTTRPGDWRARGKDAEVTRSLNRLGGLFYLAQRKIEGPLAKHSDVS